MTTVNGLVIINVKNLGISSEDDLAQSLTWLIPSIAKQVYKDLSSKSRVTPKVDISGTVTGAGPGGVSGTVSASGTVAGGTVTGTISGGTGGGTVGVTGGSVTGTWHF
ncbi:hypothetical protein [Xanthobacter sp. 126]|uniref:hypothetical protein n=1 Tax=Xanthobacter sp. 126 TaxID=1131814 RepID=UPI0012DDC6E1|nr:hypothetical protein [Xanthobacter sp. 126]